MDLNKKLREGKSEIIRKWHSRVLEAYPDRTSAFLKNQTNRFANPVGYNINTALEAVVDYLCNDKSEDEMRSALDGLVRIKAVQEFGASDALRFVFGLKEVIREYLGPESSEPGVASELLKLYASIDELALVAFDIYMQCREKIYELKASELQNQTYRLLQKANASEARGKGD